MAFVEPDWLGHVPAVIGHAHVPGAQPDGGESGSPQQIVVENGGDNWEGDADHLFSAVVAYAYDIAVTTDEATPTQLKHQVVEYNGAGGSELLVLHVLIPSIAASVDTTVRVYYRDDGAADQQQTVYLAADGWRMYLPLQEAAGTFYDLSDEGNDGVDIVSATGKTGLVGSGQEFDGVSDRIEGGTTNWSTTVGTIMFWLNADSIAVDPIPFSMYTAINNQMYIRLLNSVGNNAQPYAFFRAPDGTSSILGATPRDFAPGNWHHLALTYDDGVADQAELFYDAGSEGTSTARTVSQPKAVIGAYRDVSFELDGYMDEVSYSSVVRSDDWITTLYNCQKPGGNDVFWTVGSEVLVPKGHPALRRYLYIPHTLAA